MSRWQLLVILPLTLSGCQLFQAPQPPLAAEPALECPAPPEPQACPEPVEIIRECPAPEPVVVAEVKPAPAPKVAPAPIPTRMGDKQLLIIGAAEQVLLDPPGIVVNARIDTGAETSSLHANNIIGFEREGERWVRFDLILEGDAEPITIERPLSRKVRIKRQDAESDRRRVVEMRVRIGDIDEEIEFTLSDRSDFVYPMLIGRNFLTDNAVVDVARKFSIR